MSTSTAVRISPDVGRNRVLIVLSGNPTAAMFTHAERELAATLERLRPPVDVLSDIRDLEALSEQLVEDFRRVGAILGRFGTRRVVRLIGKTAQGALHMERLSRQLKHHGAHLAFSMAEVEQVFAK